MSTWQTVGKVRMTPKGVYDSTVAYDILDLVSNSDETTFYIAKQAVPAGTALTNTSYWVVMADVSEAVENAEDILSYIADAYSTSSAYSVGDYVIHDGSLYKCIVSIPSGENWNSAHWTEASLTGDMSDFGDTVNNVVLVQDTEPTNTKNKIWLKETTPEGVQIPTYSEFQTGISAKVNINQGSGNSGKAMIVGSDGNLSPQTIDTGVTSVAGKTGAVTLDGDDVGYSDNYTYDSGTIGSAVSNLKSQTDVLTENVLIEAETETSYIHDTVSAPRAITFYGNELAFDTARYANKTNLLPGGVLTRTFNNVQAEKNGNFVIYNGTATSTSNSIIFEENVSLSAGTYKIIARMSDIAYSASSCRFIVSGKYEGASSYVDLYSQWTGGASFEAEFTATDDLISIRVLLGIRKDVVYNNYRTWVGIYPDDVIVVDTNETVQPDGTFLYTNALLSNISTIDTMQHQSAISITVPTKEYVDSHVPDIKTYWTEEIYALPEKFGAIGNGVADDTNALLACIAYSKSSGKAVRGYGKYKTTSPIILDAKEMDVYLREMVYTGNQYAVDIQNSIIEFGFHSITSNAVGIRFGKTTVGASRFGSRCKVTGVYISSSGDCIYALPMTIYNTCRIRCLSSANGNCITFEPPVSETEFRAGEWVFENSTCACPNGYVAYNVFSSKFYNFTVETDVKYGLLNPENCLCVGWRHREQIDGMSYRVFGIDQEHNNGPLITFTADANSDGINGFRYIAQDPIYWFSLDLSTIQGYETAYDADDWIHIACNHVELGVPIRGATQYSREYVGSKAYFIGNNLVIAPGCRKESVIDIATVDFRLFDSRVDADIVSANSLIPYLCTDYIIDTDTVIRFNAYFGAVGYNDLTITQQNGHTCVVYDKLGSVLFDGTNEGDGVWHLKCTINRSSKGRYAYTPQWWCYDGTNEKWEITKIS